MVETKIQLIGHDTSIPYIEVDEKYQNVETVTILCRICVYKISKNTNFENISPWHFFGRKCVFRIFIKIWWSKPVAILGIWLRQKQCCDLHRQHDLKCAVLCCLCDHNSVTEFASGLRQLCRVFCSRVCIIV